MDSFRNQPSKVTGKTDVIDRWIKKRLILFDSSLIVDKWNEYWAFLWFDVVEFDPYTDIMLLCNDEEDVAKTRQFAEHWMIKPADVIVRYSNVEELRKQYKIILAIAPERERRRYVAEYKCPFLGK